MGRGIRRIAPEGKKWCPGHKDFLDVGRFTKDRSAKDGLCGVCADCQKVIRRRSYKKQGKLNTMRQYKRNYGITKEEYEQLYQMQNGLCAVCGFPETKMLNGEPYSLSVDHCHKSSRVRGLLCNGCNTSLGLLKEDAERIRSLLAYVEKWRKDA